jgi:hypothetical protein
MIKKIKLKYIISVLVLISIGFYLGKVRRSMFIKNNFFIKGETILGGAVMKNSKDSIIYFKDIKKNTLIVKYSELNCKVCIDSMISVIKEFEKKNINVIYIADYRIKRYLYLFKRINKISNEIYRTDFKSSIDTLNVPYVYVIENDLIQKSIYIPKKENMMEFRDYLNEITKKYFSNSLKPI